MNTRHFSQLPKAALAYPKVVQGLIFKKPKGEKVLPKVEYVVDTLEIDQNHLKAYNEVKISIDRQHYVLKRMLVEGVISKKTYQQAKQYTIYDHLLTKPQ